MATVVVTLAQGVEKLEAVAIAETRSGESRIAATGLSRTVHVSGLKITSRESWRRGNDAARWLLVT